jgi:mannose/fructose/N-acetylgalactosamine-specific phosphotransferase system component IIB
VSIVLARIDDRLIHGQVTVGWSQRLRPDRIVLVNDAVADDPWQSRVYSSSVPPSVEVAVLTVAHAAPLLSGMAAPDGAGRVILLTATPWDMLALWRAGVALDTVNVGGMYHVPGKHSLLPYVYVDAADLRVFREFLAGGCRLTAQQVPGGRELSIDDGVLDAMEGRL